MPSATWAPWVDYACTKDVEWRSATSRRGVWLLPAVGVAVIGIVAAMLGSMVVARSADQKSHQSAVTSPAEIVSTLKLAVDREQDLGVNAVGFILGNQSAPETQFQ